jgi:AbrB family looped-hinge helix DNA binding protein
MAIVTLSDKYQIIIPKVLCGQLNLKPGQKLQVSKTADGDILIKVTSVVDEMYGALKGAWGKDSDTYLTKLRNE